MKNEKNTLISLSMAGAIGHYLYSKLMRAGTDHDYDDYENYDSGETDDVYGRININTNAIDDNELNSPDNQNEVFSEDEKGNPTNAETLDEIENSLICSSCCTINNENEKFCKNCGAILIIQTEAPQVPEEEPTHSSIEPSEIDTLTQAEVPAIREEAIACENGMHNDVPMLEIEAPVSDVKNTNLLEESKSALDDNEFDPFATTHNTDGNNNISPELDIDLVAVASAEPQIAQAVDHQHTILDNSELDDNDEETSIDDLFDAVKDENPPLMDNVEPLHKIDKNSQAAKNEYKSIMDFFNTL